MPPQTVLAQRIFYQNSSHQLGRKILTRKSSTMPAPRKPKPDFTSPLISTVGIIPVASNLHRIKLLPFAYNATKPCPSGITPLGRNCRVILVWSLREQEGAFISLVNTMLQR